MIGGKYGIRAIGAGYPASEHSQGVAILNCKGHDQDKDPFFSGAADWAVWERNVGLRRQEAATATASTSRNGGDWNIVRFNETYGNLSSDFQINADPASTCDEDGIRVHRSRAATPMRARAKAAGARATISSSTATTSITGCPMAPNFTSVRRSVDPQQHLRPADAPQRELLAGDRQSAARLQRQQDPAQPVRHDRPSTA